MARSPTCFLACLLAIPTKPNQPILFLLSLFFFFSFTAAEDMPEVSLGLPIKVVEVVG